MVKSTENGSSPVAPFLLKCYEMVDDESTNSLICWSETHNDSFVIWDVSTFSSELLPKYFKHSNFSSFVRQLNIYGFRKTDTDRWEFSNDEFVEGQKHLLRNIVRRKQPLSQEQIRSSQQKDTNTVPSEEDKKAALSKEVETLKVDKNALMQELMKLRKLQETSQSKLILLREQLKGVETNQQQMLSFIVLAMQNPGFFVQLLKPKENTWHAAKTGKNATGRTVDSFDPVSSDGMIVRYQAPVNEVLETPSNPPSSDLQQATDYELSDDFRDFLMNNDFMPGFDEKLLPLPAENLGPLVLPDSADGDFPWEQLLLSSPEPGCEDTAELDSEIYLDTGMEMDPTFQAVGMSESRSAMEGSDYLKGVEKQPDSSESMGILTAEMDSRNSNWRPQV